MATFFTSLVIALLALFFPLADLANTTSFIILYIFALVNAALIRLKWRGTKGVGEVSYPILVPIWGLIFSLMFRLMKNGSLSSLTGGH